MSASAAAQNVRVTPSSVNAYSQGATTVYLTFSGLGNRRPAEACWCGDLIPATPDIGFKCNPAKVFGCLPARYDQSRLGANGTYTDIMSITPAVARRAYLEAANGEEATFFYVRRFVNPNGGPDEFVPVTIRLTGNGAAVPFSLTEVKLTWGVNKPVLLIGSDEKLPKVQAEIKYTGTGRLKGRWELVKPGEELPEDFDLLTEATLPPELRGRQRRYTQLSRFNIFLPPTGRFTLPGPETWRVPSHIEGQYLVLIRIEAVEDLSGNSNLPSIGAGPASVTTGGVAGFPMPVLRYYVGGKNEAAQSDPKKNEVRLLTPEDKAEIKSDAVIEFSWIEIEGVSHYTLVIEDSAKNTVLSAILLAGETRYQAPSWLKDKLSDGKLHWKVIAFGRNKEVINETQPRGLQILK